MATPPLDDPSRLQDTLMLFQCHHQPFVYFANVGGDPAAWARRLKDETDFLAALQDGTLPQVAWLKPHRADDQHAG